MAAQNIYTNEKKFLAKIFTAISLKILPRHTSQSSLDCEPFQGITWQPSRSGQVLSHATTPSYNKYNNHLVYTQTREP